MKYLLLLAIVAIVSALIFYTIGVWSERFSERLKPWHMIFFWTGFLFDTIGTTSMSLFAGHFEFNLHGITGLLAIALMFCHAIWATVVLIMKQENALRNFHKFSLFVWLVWLVPFFTGMIGTMLR